MAGLTLPCATQKPINIGYSATDDCAHGRIQLYRVG
jgi:hypothetical protein